jgi:hypothetical protein
MVLLLVPEMIASLNTRLGWASILVGVVVARVLFRRYATSIKDIPGPFWGSFSSLWVVYQLWKGHLEAETINLHKKHGMKSEILEHEV